MWQKRWKTRRPMDRVAHVDARACWGRKDLLQEERVRQAES